MGSVDEPSRAGGPETGDSGMHTLLERLRDAHVYNATLLNAVVDALIQIDENGTIQVFNRSAERMFGWRAAEVVGRNVNMLMPTTMAHHHDGYLHAYMNGGPARIIGIGRETMAMRRDGSTFPIDLSVGQFEARGRTAFIGTIRDLSRRKAIEDALEERQVELQSMYDQAPVAIATCNLDGRIISANIAFAELACRRLSELEQAPLAQLLAPDDRALHERSFGLLLSGERELMDLELSMLCGQEAREVAAHYAMVRLQQDKRIVVIHFIDRSAQLAAEREARAHRDRLAHVDRLSTMGELASGIAHEVNQPLTAISAYARACQRLYQNGQCETGDFAEALNQIAAQADRAGQIVHRLRTFVRRGEVQIQSLWLDELFSNVLDLLRTDLTRTEVKVVLEVEPGLPEVSADAVQIQQVLINLIRNGIEAMQDNTDAARQIAVSAAAQGGSQVVISISDQGAGISPDIVQSLFDPFATSKPSGMGLGLTISKSIVQAHGGELWHEPLAPRGTCFRFTLPVVRSAQ